MERFFDSTYDPRQDSGSSAGDTSDLHPERSYDTDIRRLDEGGRATADRADTRNERMQGRAKKFMAAARAAGAFRQRAETEEPKIRGRTPRNPATINGVEVPSQGDAPGARGTVQYATKPQSRSGKSFS
jgi:hypothetical protein